MRALALATVAKSLVFQAPDAWDVLTGRGFDITFAASADVHAERLSEWGEFRDVKLSRENPLASAASMRHITSLVRATEFLQVQSPIAAAVARLVPGRWAPEFSIYVAHGLHVTRDFGRAKNLALGSVEHALAGRTGAIALVSREDFNLARRLGWGQRSLIWQLPGAGIDVHEFQSAAEVAPRRFVPKTALYCGELNQNKDFNFACAVASKLKKRGEIEQFLVVGDGPLRPAAELMAQQPWVTYVPYSMEIPQLMARSHVLLHTSHREGLPRVIIEAMGSGLPVLARSNRGSRQLVSSDVGKVMPRDATIDDWCRGAHSLLVDEWDAVSARLFAKKYSVSEFKKSYSSLVDHVLSGVRSGYYDEPKRG